MSLRKTNRLNAMRLTQRTALPMFVQRGFDNVTVTEIAETVGMAPSTLYRHFPTKEDIVLWDEHDAAIDEALEKRLKKQPPLAAIGDAFAEELGGRYDADLDFQLSRIQYIYATQQVHAAAVEADLKAREDLTAALNHFLKRKNKPAAAILAGASLLALDIAIEKWQAGNAKQDLGELIRQQFHDLARLDSLA